jgi:hypothetical protein
MKNNWLKETEDFFSNYETAKKTVKNKTGFSFNLLVEQCGSVVENSHTNFLMRLLQYKNQHGYAFLEDFIALAEFDIQIGISSNIQFETEYFGKNENGSAGRIDGLIYEKDVFAIIIENKINHAGNQKEQIKRYIETILKDQIVSNDKQIFVVYLTRDGVEKPDTESITCMKNHRICDEVVIDNTNNIANISGPRYFACSYSANIVDWLKENIQPSVSQKDFVLNAGLIQYIDYLEKELGMRGEYSFLMKGCMEWFDKNILIEGDIATKNALLYDFYTWIDKDYLIANPQANMDGINMLKNIINEKNDELMSTFLSVTKDFFSSGLKPLMQNYHLNHHFTYYYISIRDKIWPKGIDFGWYPLGMNKLGKPDELTFYFKIQRKEVDSNSELGKALYQKGYTYNEKSKSYRVKLSVPLNETFLGLNPVAQESFLRNVYQEYAVPIIRLLV